MHITKYRSRFSAWLLVCLSSAFLVNIVPAEQALPVCHMIATGGTIAMKIDPVKKAPMPALSGEDLVASVPELSKIATVRVENLFNIPSGEMGPEPWIQIQKSVLKALSNDEVAGVIISHGTDTLEETAYFLDLTISSDKPVVLVGAQRNASEPDFDGPRNLLNAARICASSEARGKGVMITLNSHINAARDVTKTQTSDVETFKSGDFGFLGSVDLDRVVFARNPIRRQSIGLKANALPRVDIVTMYAGADGSLLQAAVAAGAKGIVIQALGLGNVNALMSQAIKKTIKQGIVIAISTRVPNGRVVPVYGNEGGGKNLKDAGAVFADNLSPQKARILLMLALQNTSDAEEIQQLFDK